MCGHLVLVACEDGEEVFGVDLPPAVVHLHACVHVYTVRLHAPSVTLQTLLAAAQPRSWQQERWKGDID